MTTIILEGKEYQIDIEQAKELGLLKEKDDRVKSWKEFELKYSKNKGYYWNSLHNGLVETNVPTTTKEQLTPHEAKAIDAFSKLIKLRRDWLEKWEPDWTKTEKDKYCICNKLNEESDIIELTVDYFKYLIKPLSFPTKQMALEFLETFHDLIKDAKILI